jgi:hypothetical protein
MAAIGAAGSGSDASKISGAEAMATSPTEKEAPKVFIPAFIVNSGFKHPGL